MRYLGIIAIAMSPRQCRAQIPVAIIESGPEVRLARFLMSLPKSGLLWQRTRRAVAFWSLRLDPLGVFEAQELGEVRFQAC